jgi:hypothetical protein
MLDNSELVVKFCPDTDDGDTFIYTEMLDRGNKKGNNGHRLLKTFYHRSKEEFLEQVPTIKKLCDIALIRACTRLSPKSYKRVGAVLTKMTVEAALTNNWQGMKSLYNRACGITAANQKIWLFDVDVINDDTKEFEIRLKMDGNHLATIPSKKGLHYISTPFDTRIIEKYCKELSITETEMSLHKDNPTNLYIPDGAD